MYNSTLLTSSNTIKARTYLLPSLVLMVTGCLLNIFAYQSFKPFVAFVIFFMLSAFFLRLPLVGGRFERVGFRLVFAVGWFMAGIAAVYANYLNDPFQNSSDADLFFLLAISNEELRIVSPEANQNSEGAGAVVIWRAVYDIFAAIGFEKERYLGVLANVTFVAFSCVLAVKIARLVFGNDISRLNRLIFLFSMCGLFWLFAAIHLRDGLVLLAVTALCYVWTLYLTKPGMQSSVFTVLATILAFASFSFLRTEFLFVPLAMLVAGLSASFIHSNLRGTQKIYTYVIAFIGFITTGFIFLNLREALLSALFSGYFQYSEAANLRGSSTSLGVDLIVNQPIPIRLIFGSVYLFIFPIPFWVGFQLDSAYHLFKSLNVLFFYALIPLMLLSFWVIIRNKAVRSPSLMILFYITIGFTLAIAGTSLEGRHLGAFLVPILVLVLLPDLNLKKYRNTYKIILITFLFIMAMLHFIWFVIKL